MQEIIQHKTHLFEHLPNHKEDQNGVSLLQLRTQKVDTIIVLDDDPTGTQTVHGVPILTSWSIQVLLEEFQKKTPLFYILTNSRSLTSEEAHKLAYTIGKNIKEAANQSNARYWVISRSDSTLRGHYPMEVEALESSLELHNGVHFIIPAFFEGGRYTVNDVHYVENNGQLIPAALTIYAKDHVFGFKSSNLVNWVMEKWEGRISKERITTISITELRRHSTEILTKKINELAPNSICIVNAVDYKDLKHFSLAVLQSSVVPVFRTAASFVAAIAGLETKALLEKKDLGIVEDKGGLMVVGSYVKTTSGQLQHLMESHLVFSNIEIDVPKALGMDNITDFTAAIAKEIDQAIDSGQLVVLYTSRNLVSAGTDEDKQSIGKRVSNIVTSIISQLRIQPSYILTKGGITSSDIATKGLGIKRAIVIGQIIKGVPVWKLGEETKFPDCAQIIFPGNVGQVSSLVNIVNKLSI
ncbi:MAG: four-carbon acid sugar kinase family protein [Bacteroidota bacterium]